MEKGEFQRQDIRAALGRIQARVREELLATSSPEVVDRFIGVMPERYFLSVTEGEIPAQFALMQEYKGRGAAVSVEHFPEKDCSTVAICTKDRPGLFASIAGVMAAMRLDILNARIFTASDGRILDVFRVSHGGRSEIAMAEQRWSRFRSTLEAVLEGDIDVERLVEQSQSTLLRKRMPKVLTSIEIDNEASAHYTVVEVYTADRIGVLFRITYTLHQLGLSIHVAKISTNVDQVADVFFVTTEEGEKVDDAARIEAIRQTLYASLVPDDERIAAPLH
jgi:[protein-PII] uridylyltransferase